jgi:hypothetical protein
MVNDHQELRSRAEPARRWTGWKRGAGVASCTLLAIVPAAVTLVTACDNVHRQHAKRAVVRIKLML